MPGAGDLETGKAWRPVRRPSDMVSDFKKVMVTGVDLTTTV
jgi:hypothetical protein